MRRVPLPLVWDRLRVASLVYKFVGRAEQQDLLFALLQDISTESVEYLHIGIDVDGDALPPTKHTTAYHWRGH